MPRCNRQLWHTDVFGTPTIRAMVFFRSTVQVKTVQAPAPFFPLTLLEPHMGPKSRQATENTRMGQPGHPLIADLLDDHPDVPPLRVDRFMAGIRCPGDLLQMVDPCLPSFVCLYGGRVEIEICSKVQHVRAAGQPDLRNRYSFSPSGYGITLIRDDPTILCCEIRPSVPLKRLSPRGSRAGLIGLPHQIQ